jgi:5,10-methenyltetrahydromethanopterin hydrogenase
MAMIPKGSQATCTISSTQLMSDIKLGIIMSMITDITTKKIHKLVKTTAREHIACRCEQQQRLPSLGLDFWLPWASNGNQVTNERLAEKLA